LPGEHKKSLLFNLSDGTEFRLVTGCIIVGFSKCLYSKQEEYRLQTKETEDFIEVW